MFTVKFDQRRILKDLDGQKKQHLFALQLGINRTQEEKQTQLQDHAASKLTIRSAGTRAQFRKAVRFARADRADRNANKMTATIRIIGGNTAATTDLFRRLGAMLIRQDEGGTQRSDALYRTQNRQFTAGGFTLPAPGLRNASRGVSRKLYPAAIGLSARSLKFEGADDLARQYKGGRKKKRGFRKGTKYYFVKENVGIFVREQIGKQSEYDAVWFFRKSINLPKRLDLAGTYERGLQEQLAANYTGFMDFANRTAR